MPLFVYRCVECEHEDEFLVKSDGSNAPTQCEKCSSALEKKLSLSSFQLKGDGWYKDLYSSAKPSKNAD